ncbi:MAG TPA: hypothetical protein VIN33_13185 [Marinobacter sp.]|uniref:hypothetical protein n=1 Tax=Marinobacter sp. SS13-12 TaxID=3050451 RepID=UPI002555F9FC|nr:hypothetical protein [Marinobacter sp. SS13-12]MDK8463276.1 hypothetical protein [Marinobacter sp. SS13-12]
MKKAIIAAAVTALLSTMATANSGLADRINEARSYPNKSISAERSEMTCVQNKTNHWNISKSEVKYEENESGNKDLNHTHS